MDNPSSSKTPQHPITAHHKEHPMSKHIAPQVVTIDGVSVRYAEGTAGPVDALLLSPWPESVYAFEQVWPLLAEHAHLIAVDPPGFGRSDYRQELMNPKAMAGFIVRVADALELSRPHVVAPDIGTSSTLFAAAGHPDRFASLVIGSGGAAVPLQVTGVLKDWIDATDLQPYRDMGGSAIVDIALSTIAGYTPSEEIRDDYRTSYQGDRFADTIPYAQAYREQLPQLADLLSAIKTPIRIVQGSDDQVVPAVNAEYLHARLPHSRVDFIDGAGHFCWEERPDEYATLIVDWWNTNPAPAQHS
jgi:pimeloyl-ACP methyl ester carboxylesterase